MSADVLKLFKQAFAVGVLMVVVSPLACLADLYGFPETGTLSWTDSEGSDIVAGDGWKNTGTSISWSLSPNADGSIRYSYTFTALNKDLSHLDIGVSPVSADLPAFSSTEPRDYFNGPDLKVSTGWFTEGEISIYALKFESYDGTDAFGGFDSWTVTFDSYRLPMWGDFYAKDGYDHASSEWAFAYNTGFGEEYDPETNPWKIVVPDTAYVPVPGAVLLGMLGLGAAGLRLRRAV